MKKVVLALLIVACLLSIPFVLSQNELYVTYELNCNVTSTTTLWYPGTHDFEMTCEGQLSAPITETFTMNGSGTATYSMVGGGNPPGEFDVNISFSGYLNNSFFNGPFTLSAVGHGRTVLVSTTPGFIRTEEIRDLSVNGSFNEYIWNVTSQTAKVDFSFIDGQGKAFQIRVTGTSRTIIIPEFPSILILPLLTMTTLLAIAIYRKTSKRNNSF